MGSNVSPELRAWFNGVYNRKGIRCFEAADGYPVEYQMRSGDRFKGEWYEVPDEAVVRQNGNPTGSGVVWFAEVFGGRAVRCIVPVAEY